MSERPPAGGPEAPAPRTPSPLSPRAMSAARTRPLPGAPRGPLTARLRAAVSDVGLNLLAAAREAAEDFRTRDRFFRYKAGIVAGWLALSALSLAVACPGSGTADLGARLVVNAEQASVILLVHNESAEAWREVTVVVNGRWRASVEEVAAGGTLTLTPRRLMGANGTLAPLDLAVEDVELRTSEGRSRLAAAH